MSADRIYAKVIKDSISPLGHRLTSLEVCFNRFVLAEVNTHRMFSRNSASSRAIPVSKQIAKVEHNPALPVSWPAEQKGMQGGEELSARKVAQAEHAWREAADDAVIRARRLAAVGVHKSVTNRVLEPFQMHTAVITATDWQGFWDQRCSPLAQPELRVAAEKMQEAMEASTPTEIPYGFWHLPYTDESDIRLVEDYLHGLHGAVSKTAVTRTLVQVSAARSARVSYETHDGQRFVGEDVALYHRLVSARPAHFSPLEHPATPDAENVLHAVVPLIDLAGQHVKREIIRPVFGNFLGWRQCRFEVEG